MRLSELLDETHRSRYVFTQTYRKSTLSILEMDLEVISDQPGWLKDNEFLSKYCVTHDQLNLITNLISGAGRCVAGAAEDGPGEQLRRRWRLRVGQWILVVFNADY